MRFFAFKALHCLPKAGVGAVADVFGDLLERCILRLHQLVCDAHTHGDKLLAEAMSRILQNQSFGVSLGDVKLLGKVGKVHVLIVVENEKFADEEVIILDFGNANMLLTVETAKQGNIKRHRTVITRKSAPLYFVKKGFYDACLDGIGAKLIGLTVGLISDV